MAHEARRHSIARLCVMAGALWLVPLGVNATSAAAGTFAVAVMPCVTDEPIPGREAFAGGMTSKMWIASACDPEEPGTPTLTLANRRGQRPVPNGAAAWATVDAPPGTTFSAFFWQGAIYRVDCRWELKLYGERSDGTLVGMENVRANEACPLPRAVGKGYFKTSYPLDSVTRIVTRVSCVGAQRLGACPAHRTNYLRTTWAEATVNDEVAPTVAILSDTRLANGAWSNQLKLNYQADDNTGVKRAEALFGAVGHGGDARPCEMTTRSDRPVYARLIPCPSGTGSITLDPADLDDGTHAVELRAWDTADNYTTTPSVVIHIDRLPPATVAVSATGGEGWRNGEDFQVAWNNEKPDDRAPIVATTYTLCPAAGGACVGGERRGDSIHGFDVRVPSPGEWRLSLYLRDQAGNENSKDPSVPVMLRHDPEPPRLAFEAPTANDPTLVSVQVTDRLSGLADGSIEIRREESDSWQMLATQAASGRLVARVDDAALPAGRYVLRATAHDQARNEASTDRRVDGEPMAVTLPLRVLATMQAGVARERLVKRTVVRGGKRRVTARRVTDLLPAAIVRAGRRVDVVGRLVDSAGQPIAGAEIQILSRSIVNSEQQVAVVQTDADGRFRHRAPASTSQVLRLMFAGTPLIVPTQSEVVLTVPADSSLRVSRSRVRNGQTVTFSGQLRTLPAAEGDKLVELQVQLSGRWQTFRTARTDAAGRWTVPYQFKRTRSNERFRFRAWLPREAGYPFAASGSRSLTVSVRGAQ